MTVLLSRFIAALVITIALGNGMAWANCTHPTPFPYPTCDSSELVYGMCFAQDMDKAAATIESPAFRQAFRHIVNQAKAHLDQIEPASKKVVITDLDETLVNNVGYYQQSKVFAPDSWQAWISRPQQGPFHPEVLELIQYAKSRGFSVMFITGRPMDQAEETLNQVNVIDWDGIFLKPTGISLTSTLYKAEVRHMLERMGYEVVLNLGDQGSDMALPAEPEQGEFLLPNVMYFIP